MATEPGYIGADWPDAWKHILHAIPKSKYAMVVSACMFVEAVHGEAIRLLKRVREASNPLDGRELTAEEIDRIDSLIK